MTLRSRRTSWFISALVLVAAASAGLKLVRAQPRSETPRPASDTSEAAFESLGGRYILNLDNVAYTADNETFFDIFFTCSSGRNPDPLRLEDAEDVKRARAYFNDEKRHGKHFIKVNNSSINVRAIAYIERRGDSTIINFNSRIFDSFVNLKLSGPAAETFGRKIGAF